MRRQRQRRPGIELRRRHLGEQQGGEGFHGKGRHDGRERKRFDQRHALDSESRTRCGF